MAATPVSADRDAELRELRELRELLRAVSERNAKSRENVLRHAANLGRIAEELRARGR
jgi:hypothetical protein